MFLKPVVVVVVAAGMVFVRIVDGGMPLSKVRYDFEAALTFFRKNGFTLTAHVCIPMCVPAHRLSAKFGGRFLLPADCCSQKSKQLPSFIFSLLRILYMIFYVLFLQSTMTLGILKSKLYEKITLLHLNYIITF
jgi:hypothetical protein